MFIAGVMKCAFLRRPHALMSVAMPCVARVAQSSDSLHWQTAMAASAICKSVCRQFSCTCAQNFRTADSFTCYTDNDDSETSGNVVINVETAHSGSPSYLVIIS